MFYQIFQALKNNLLSHFLIIVGLIVGTVTLGAFWSNQETEKSHKEKLAKIVGYQALQIYQDQKDSHLLTTDQVEPKLLGKSHRMPASILQPTSLEKEGTIGKDPWGHPYLYKILPLSTKNIQVIVLSLGENQILDTPSFQNSTLSSEFLGDDYGVAINF
ncbi:MAG TPA: hypothetical protein PLJ21_06360 [Pseudobdellovibrionaceae bacterium]|nr:hypothetical protein [Pseudobdellovibrionaceae bacterium]